MDVFFVNEIRNRIYVANHGERSVSVIDGRSHEILHRVEVGTSPTFVAVNEVTGRVCVANSGDDTASVLDSITAVQR